MPGKIESNRLNNVKTALKVIGLIGLLGAAIAMPNILVAADKLFDIRGRKKFQKNLHQLKRSKYIEIGEIDGVATVRITEKGKDRVLRVVAEDFKVSVPKKWDGKWRMVAFDIPEKKRNARNVLRGMLRRVGFFQLQKSLMIFPYDCEKEILGMCDIFGITDHVFFMTAGQFAGDAKFKKMFILS